MSVGDEIAKLKALRDEGVLSDAEYEDQKAKVLAGETRQPQAPVATAAQKKKAVGCGTMLGIGALVIVGLAMFGGSTKKAADPTEPPIVVTADTLAFAYKQNEASAQATYGSSPLLVSGEVDGVDLDFANNPFIKLKAENQFMPVQAKLSDESKARANSLSPGDQVKVRCESVSEVIGTPILADCVIQ